MSRPGALSLYHQYIDCGHKVLSCSASDQLLAEEYTQLYKELKTAIMKLETRTQENPNTSHDDLVSRKEQLEEELLRKNQILYNLIHKTRMLLQVVSATHQSEPFAF